MKEEISFHSTAAEEAAGLVGRAIAGPTPNLIRGRNSREIRK